MGRLYELRAESEGEAVVEVSKIVRDELGLEGSPRRRGSVRVPSGIVVDYVFEGPSGRVLVRLVRSEDPKAALREFEAGMVV